MSFLRTALLASLAVLGPLAADLRAQDSPRYSAQMVDGSRITGRDLSNWHEKGHKDPKLDNRSLFDKGNPARWLIDHRIKPEEALKTPDEFVEFFGGDRMPAKVQTFRFGNEDPAWTLPPHLVVAPTVPIQRPDHRAAPLRVGTTWLRRVVWQRRGEQYRPATVFFRDGRQLDFRAMRWGPSSIRLLREQGTMEVPFDQIAELHLARMNPWDAHFDQLAALLPSGTGRWMQWDTSTGMTLTGSLNRFDASSRSGNDPAMWYHLVQPAWALDPINVEHRTIRVRRYFAAHEIPLTSLEPSASKQKNSLGAGWNWQQGRSVQGEFLRSKGEEYGWGFGVHAYNELEFELHPAARKLRTRMGLDEAAGTGGCAQGLIYVGPRDGKATYEGKILVGAGEVLDTGFLDLPAQEGVRKLTLVADPVHQQRPPGADPLDIRDTFDWLEPLVELDAGEVEKEIRQRVSRQIPAWRNWTVADENAAIWENQWDGTNPREPRFRLLPAARERIVLKRTVTIEEGQNWLLMAVSRLEQGTVPARVRVKIEGQEVGKFEVPLRRGSGDPDPLAVPVDKYRGKEVKLEIQQSGDGPTALVDWRSVALVDQLPGLKRVYEDEATFLEQLVDGDSQAALETQDRYAGQNAIRLTPGAKYNPRISGLSLAVRDDPRLGEYRFIRFAWKKRGGESIVLELAHEGLWGKGGKRNAPSFRYDASPAKGSTEAALRVEKKIPAEWVVVTRDLYQDFGSFDLTGLSLNCVDGEQALFDHIYLARTLKDFERIESPAVALDAREAEESLKGKNGADAGKIREAMMLYAEAETLHRGQDNAGARIQANRALSLLPPDSPLVRKVKKLLEKIDGG